MMTSQCPLSKKGVSQLCQDQGQHTLYWHSAAKSEKYVQFWDVTFSFLELTDTVYDRYTDQTD